MYVHQRPTGKLSSGKLPWKFYSGLVGKQPRTSDQRTYLQFFLLCSGNRTSFILFPKRKDCTQKHSWPMESRYGYRNNKSLQTICSSLPWWERHKLHCSSCILQFILTKLNLLSLWAFSLSLSPEGKLMHHSCTLTPVGKTLNCLQKCSCPHYSACPPNLFVHLPKSKPISKAKQTFCSLLSNCEARLLKTERYESRTQGVTILCQWKVRGPKSTRKEDAMLRNIFFLSTYTGKSVPGRDSL